MSNQKIRVLIIEPNPVLRDALSSIVNRQPDMKVVGQGAIGAQCRSMVVLFQPDVVLLDWKAADEAPVNPIPVLQEQGIPVLVLTLYGESAETQRALRAGARSCLLKDATTAELLKAIRGNIEGVGKGGTQ